MRIILACTITLLAGLTFSGCAQAGLFTSANLTEVQLRSANYQIVAINVHGEADAAYLLGVSFSTGMATQTLALWRVDGTGLLYKEAMENLWANFAAEHGPIAQRKLALVNVRYDSDNLNLLLYTQGKISIRADIVEFTE